MSPASLASSVEWAQSALMEIEHLAATEAKVFDKEVYTNPSVWTVPDHPASQASTKGRAKEEYAHLALSGSDVAEVERLREIEGLADRVEEAQEAAGGWAADNGGWAADAGGSAALAASWAQTARARKSEEAGVASAGESGDFLGRGWGRPPAQGETAQLLLREDAGGAERHAVKSGVCVEEAVLLALQGAQQALCSQLQHLRACLKTKCDLMQTYQDKMAPLAKGKALELISSLETMLVKLKRQVLLALLLALLLAILPPLAALSCESSLSHASAYSACLHLWRIQPAGCKVLLAKQREVEGPARTFHARCGVRGTCWRESWDLQGLRLSRR